MSLEVFAIVGTAGGDEGKGKIIHKLSEDADIVARGTGGSNAGHTIVDEAGHKFALHLIPSGIFNPDTTNILGRGMVVHPGKLMQEMKDLQEQGVSVDSLRLDPRAHLVFDYHIALDGHDETGRGSKKINTTNQGIGPAYTDKARRIGIQANVLADKDKAMEQIASVLAIKQAEFRSLASEPMFQPDYYEELLKEAQAILGPLLFDPQSLFEQYIRENKGKIVLEGAQAQMLTLSGNGYPNVTSSETTVDGLAVGVGFPASRITRRIGVVKAYFTRVGAGGNPTELNNEQGESIRKAGDEYGATTGRPRRVGFFDGVQLRTADLEQDFTDIAVTRIDTLSGQGPMKICHAYTLDNETVNLAPVNDDTLQRCTAVYDDRTYQWTGNLSDVRKLGDLPKDAQMYCARIKKFTKRAELSWIGVGPKGEDLITI